MDIAYKDVITLKQLNNLSNKDGIFLFYNDSGCGYCLKILKEVYKLSKEEKSKITLVSISHFNSDFLVNNLKHLPFIETYNDNTVTSRVNNLSKLEEVQSILKQKEQL